MADPVLDNVAGAATGGVDPVLSNLADSPAAVPTRGALGELGTGLARGAVVDLPRLIGQGLRYASSPGRPVYNAGQGMVASADQRGQAPGLTLQPQAHGPVLNALAGGAEAIPAVLGTVGLGMAGAAAGLPAAGAAALTALGAGTMFGASAGQDTLDKASAAGVDPEAAKTAARLNAASTFALQAGMGLVGGRTLGVFGNALNKIVGKDAGELAANTLSELTGRAGVVAPVLKQLPYTAAEATAINAGQAATTAGIEQHYGIDKTSPVDAAIASIPSSLGLTAVLGPAALVTRGMQVRSAQARTMALAAGKTDPSIRTQLADQYAAELAKVNPQAAAMFKGNAGVAIAHGQDLPAIDSMMFDPGHVQPPAPAPTPAAPLMIGYDANRVPNAMGELPMYVFPDSTTSRDPAQVESYINTLPPDQQTAARARLLGMGARPADMTSLGAAEAKPAAVEPEANAPDLTTSPGAQPPAAANGIDFTRDVDTANMQLEGPNAPKTPGAITADWKAAMEANEMDTKQQSLVPFQKRVNALGLADMNTHQQQIDALNGMLQGKLSQGMRDRVQMLVDKWQAERPQQPTTPVEDAAKNALPEQPEKAVQDAKEAVQQVHTLADSGVVSDEQAGVIAANMPKAEEAEEPALQGEAPEHAAETGENIMAGDRFTPAQQTLLDGLRKGSRTTQLEKMRDDLSTQLTALMEQHTAGQNVDAQLTPLLQRVDDVEAVAGEALARDREDRAQKQLAAANAPKPESPAYVSVSAIADSALVRAAALRAAFTARMRAGEVLSDPEAARWKSLNEVAKALDPYIDGQAAPRDENFVRQLSAFIDDASTPWTKLPDYMDPNDEDPGPFDRVLTGLKMDSPEQVDPGLMAPSAISGKARDTLEHIAAQGSTPYTRALAAKLQPLLPETTIARGGPQPTKTVVENGKPVEYGTGARFDPTKNHIDVFDGGESEATILHEATHAATLTKWYAGQELLKRAPRTQDEAKLRDATQRLQGVYDDAAKLPGAKEHYGMADVPEFIAEAHASPKFREFLQRGSLWDRFIDGTRRLLGMAPRDNDLLTRAISASEPFFAENTIKASMDDPRATPWAVDGTLNRLILANDGDKRRMADVADNVFGKYLGWRTVSNIAYGVQGIPTWQKAFAPGVKAQDRANTVHAMAGGHFADPGNKYVNALDRYLRAQGDKRQSLLREMSEISSQASIDGFDYRKSGKDNLAANKSLDAGSKALMDDVYRRFTQLQRTYPEAAKAIEQGEKLMRGSLVNDTATVLKQVMDARSGVAARLAGELATMTPEDANRAQLESRVRAANLESTIGSVHSPLLDALDKQLEKQPNTNEAKYASGADATLATRLDAAFKAAAALPDGTPLKNHARALESIYRAQESKPYFSLGRDGDYFVNVKFQNMTPQMNDRIQAALKDTQHSVGNLMLNKADSAFFRMNSADEARSLHDKLVQAGQGNVVGTSMGKVATHFNDVTGAYPALRALMSEIDEHADAQGLKGPVVDDMKALMRDKLLSMLPETAARSASMGRKGVPGYNNDFTFNFSRRFLGGAQKTAGLYTSQMFADAAKMRADAIKELNSNLDPTAVRAQMIDDELNRRYANMMKPASNSAVGWLTSISHAAYLGLSPAFYIRAAAQPWHRGLPILGSKFGHAGGMAALAEATPTALKIVYNSVKEALQQGGVRGLLGSRVKLDGLNLPAHEQEFLERLHDEGVFDLGESTQLAQQGVQGAGRKMQDFLKLASFTAGLSEMSNRAVMGLAAFRMASKRPELLAKGQTPTEYAIAAIKDAMDDFSPANTARNIGRHGVLGDKTPLFTQFSNYQLQTMQRIFSVAHEGFFGADKSPEGLQRSKEARREFGGLMATTSVISGALGLPFANLFAGLYNMATKDSDDPGDVRVSIRNWAKDTFGETAGRVMTGGVGTLANLDMSTFGLQDIMPGSEFLASRALWKDRAETQARSSMGPAISLGMDLGEAVSKLSDGYWLKGVEKALPVGLRTYYKTAEMAGLIGPGGYTDSKGNPTPERMGAGDLAWRALGFQTAQHAEISDAQRDFSQNQELLQHRRQVIGDRFIKGATGQGGGNPVEDLMRFNAANPFQMMNGQELAGDVRSYMLRQALGGAGGMGFGLNKRQLLPAMQQERFAAMPGG